MRHARGKHIERNQVRAFGEDGNAVDREGETAALLVVVVAQLDAAQAGAAMAFGLLPVRIVDRNGESIQRLAAVADRKPQARMGDAQRNVDVIRTALERGRLSQRRRIGRTTPAILQLERRFAGAVGLDLDLRGQCGLIGADAVLRDMQIGDAQRVPAFQTHRFPDAGGDIARSPIPAVVITGLAREVLRHRIFRLVAVRRRVVARELERHRLHRRQQARDRRMQDDAQFVAARLELALRGQAPGAEHIVGRGDFPAVEVDVGKRVEAVENEILMRELQRRRIDVERRAVFPIGQPDPLQFRLVRADVGVDDRAVGQQIGVDIARHRRVLPGRGGRMRAGRRARGEAHLPVVSTEIERGGNRGRGRRRKKQGGEQKGFHVNASFSPYRDRAALRRARPTARAGPRRRRAACRRRADDACRAATALRPCAAVRSRRCAQGYRRR